MWKTPLGVRVLRGQEAQLFQKGLSILVEKLGEFGERDESHVGISRFDNLSPPERFAALWASASALLEEEVVAPTPSAIGEAAIAAVYEEITMVVDLELGYEDQPVCKLLADLADQFDIDRPEMDSSDHQGWHEVVELLMDRILWDRDFEIDIIRPDDSPATADARRKFYDIDPEYYSAVPFDPTPAQQEEITVRLDRLCTIQL